MSQEDAEKTVNDWTASYNDVKAQAQAAKDEAAAKAREAANESARVMAVLSFVAFVGLGFGAVAATLGGKCGAKHARKYDVQAVPVA